MIPKMVNNRGCGKKSNIPSFSLKILQNLIFFNYKRNNINLSSKVFSCHHYKSPNINGGSTIFFKFGFRPCLRDSSVGIATKTQKNGSRYQFNLLSLRDRICIVNSQINTQRNRV